VATGYGQVRVAAAAADGQAVALTLRPEQIAVGAADTGLFRLGLARVTDATFLGGHWRVLARAEATGEPLLLHLPAVPAPKQGDRLDLAAPPDRLVLLPAER
jgi:ABC-type Fe3+/spermidine/putrescine transport system ATPase subunit